MTPPVHTNEIGVKQECQHAYPTCITGTNTDQLFAYRYEDSIAAFHLREAHTHHTTPLQSSANAVMVLWAITLFCCTFFIFNDRAYQLTTGNM